MPRYRLAPFPLAAALAMSAITAQAADPLQAQVDEVIRPLMQEHQIAGMAVALYADGQAHYFNYGVANKADNSPVSADTLFEVGSLSKTYTATLAALASAEGKLDLHAPAQRYQPALAGTPLGEASVLEFGAYSADCLPLQFPDAVHTDEQVLAFFRHWQPVAKHGTQRCYSNPSLGLFGDLAARAQHRPFAELMTEGLLPQMGLKHTCTFRPMHSGSMRKGTTRMTSRCASARGPLPMRPMASRPAPPTCCATCACTCNRPNLRQPCKRLPPLPRPATSRSVA